MTYQITRRKALAGLSSAALLPLVGCSSSDPKSSQLEVFQHGVASGDPDADSIVLWSRVSGFNRNTDVRWEVTDPRDVAFAQPLAAGTTQTGANRDYTVKVLVEKLQPGQVYIYRFIAGGQVSETGRTRTLPTGHVAQLGIALASCSNYPFGYFNAYEAIANDDEIDLVLHLGDYIYEYGAEEWGGDVGANLQRLHQPAHEIVSLADYRTRHGQYKSDPQSRAMHAAHPLVAIWDDHESTNNPWMGGAENHQPGQEGPWNPRRDASLQAYFEWMPVREPALGMSRQEYWRHFEFGDLASLITLETRHSGRSRQIEYHHYRSALTDPAAARKFMREIVGAEDRNMLSAEMENFVIDAISQSVASDRPWRLIGNQIPMARTHIPTVTEAQLQRIRREVSEKSYQRIATMAGLAQLDLPLYLDPWDGYPAARERFYRRSASAGARDLLVLTGDSHSFWSNSLYDAEGLAMGVEIGTTGISSPGDFVEFGEWGANLLDRRLAEHNREVEWTNCQSNGYVRLVVDHSKARADYVAVDTVLKRNYSTRVIRSVDIGHSNGTLVYHS